MNRRILIFVGAVALAAVLAMPRADRAETAVSDGPPAVQVYASEAAHTIHSAATWSRQTVSRVRRHARNLARRAHLL